MTDIRTSKMKTAASLSAILGVCLSMAACESAMGATMFALTFDPQYLEYAASSGSSSSNETRLRKSQFGKTSGGCTPPSYIYGTGSAPVQVIDRAGMNGVYEFGHLVCVNLSIQTSSGPQKQKRSAQCQSDGWAVTYKTVAADGRCLFGTVQTNKRYRLVD